MKLKIAFLIMFTLTDRLGYIHHVQQDVLTSTLAFEKINKENF